MDIIHGCKGCSAIPTMNANSLCNYACCSKICMTFSKDRIFLAGNEDILHQQLSSRKDQYDEATICIGIL